MKAKDINSQRFEKAAFGYKQEDVDGFLNELAADYSQLEKENEEINAKLQVLADKVREYRKDEDAVRDALLFAQKEGHRVVSEANAKAEEVLSNAKSESDKIIGNATLDSRKAVDDLKAKIKQEQDNLSFLQKKVADFKKDLFDMYKLHLELITSMPQYEEEDDEDEEEETVKAAQPAASPVSAAAVQQAPANPMHQQSQTASQLQFQQFQKPVQVQAAVPTPAPAPKPAAPVQTQAAMPQDPASVKEDMASGKLDPFRTQTIPVINAGDNKYAELQFGQHQ